MLFVAAACPAARLTPEAERAFDSYITDVEARLAAEHASAALAALSANGAARDRVERQLRSGILLVEPVHGGTWDAGGALLHHWRGTAFVPGATAPDMLALVRDPGHLARYYAPQVVASHALPAEGKTTSLIRFKKQKIVTVILDAQFEGRSELIGNAGYSYSRSVHIWQIDHPGTAQEQRRREGRDDGFLWRLNSYWSFLEAPDGLFIECEAVSLTRDVPLGLGWLLMPVIQSLPRESLQFTLSTTRNVLQTNYHQEAHNDRRD